MGATLPLLPIMRPRTETSLHAFLEKQGDVVSDLGHPRRSPSIYNDFAELVAQEVFSGRAEFGILMCSSGDWDEHDGESSSARFAAALVTTPADAAGHPADNMQTFSASAPACNAPASARLVEAFLTAQFEGGRHERGCKNSAQHPAFGERPTPLRKVDPQIADAIRCGRTAAVLKISS